MQIINQQGHVESKGTTKNRRITQKDFKLARAKDILTNTYRYMGINI